MSTYLTGKASLVTGGWRGMGAIALGFDGAGAQIVVAGRTHVGVDAQRQNPGAADNKIDTC